MSTLFIMMDIAVLASPSNSRVEQDKEQLNLICDEGIISIGVGEDVKVFGKMTKELADDAKTGKEFTILGHGNSLECSRTIFSTSLLRGRTTTTKETPSLVCEIFGNRSGIDSTLFSCSSGEVEVKPSDDISCYFLLSCTQHSDKFKWAINPEFSSGRK